MAVGVVDFEFFERFFEGIYLAGAILDFFREQSRLFARSSSVRVDQAFINLFLLLLLCDFLNKSNLRLDLSLTLAF